MIAETYKLTVSVIQLGGVNRTLYSYRENQSNFDMDLIFAWCFFVGAFGKIHPNKVCQYTLFWRHSMVLAIRE